LAVLSEKGWTVLVEAGTVFADARGDALTAATTLAQKKPNAPAAWRAAALELVTEGARLARKLGLSPQDRLLAVREAVEQASSGRVAAWHAQQVPEGTRVLEIGCGCGGDSLALGRRAANLIACDLDPVRAACAHINLANVGITTARAVPLDGLDVLQGEGRRAEVLFVDPDRRAEDKRLLDPESWRPPLSRLRELAVGERPVFVKAAPSLDAEAVSDIFRVAYVSHAGECVEAFLQSPHAGAEDVRAVLLSEDGSVLELTGDRGRARAGPLSWAIYAVDPAAIRARLLAELCTRHDLQLVDPEIAILTGARGVESPWLRGYEVLSTMPLNPADVLAELRALRPSQVRVRTRGVPIPAPQLERRFAETVARHGKGPAIDVFATRVMGEATAVLTRRIGPK
jgi:hypothetical protein